jgi:hypothetical protein
VAKEDCMVRDALADLGVVDTGLQSDLRRFKSSCADGDPVRRVRPFNPIKQIEAPDSGCTSIILRVNSNVPGRVVEVNRQRLS